MSQEETGAVAARTGLLTAGGVQAAARTDRGPVREVNEDSYVCEPAKGLFAVIDGMGGHHAGETAARIVREELLLGEDVVVSLSTANEKVHQTASSTRDLSGMGCVASALQVTRRRARIAHVGDTRIYLASAAGCEQLTRDHTVAATRQEELGLSERRARKLEGHNQVTRDIGGNRRSDNTWIDDLSAKVAEGDLLLLCSDGLHGSIPRNELVEKLRAAVRSSQSPEVLAETLVNRALELGTRDNVTVVVVRRTAAPPDDEKTPTGP